MTATEQNLQHDSVNRAFSKQSDNYDEEDKLNKVLQDLRQQVYEHVKLFLKPNSHILELNAGTGIDAHHFVKEGHTVHATDLSDGMISQIKTKIHRHDLHTKLTCQQLSYDQLDKLTDKKFDYVFSNFGGLNCIADLTEVTKNLPKILNDGAFVTFVIMPPVCLWELFWLLKGNTKAAFRRLHNEGVMAHLEGEHFKTYYHSLRKTKDAFGKNFKLIKAEGLASISPPPASVNFPNAHPRFYSVLRFIDSWVRSSFPFDRWGDHIMVTVQWVK